MRQFKITSENILPSDTNDCVIDPADPMHDLIKTSIIGGIGADATLAQYNTNALMQRINQEVANRDPLTFFRNRKK